MNIRKLIIFQVLVLFSFGLSAQESKVIVSMSGENTSPVILVKWFTNDIFPGDGIYVYRSTDEKNWEKLTRNPIKKGNFKIEKKDLKEDSTLQPYINLANGLQTKDLKGFAKLMVLTKASFSRPFANYIGIEFDDATVGEGVSYKYKVTILSGSKEQLVGYSAFITVGKFKCGEAPKKFQIKVGDRASYINWEPEDTRFLAVNIYRNSLHDPVFHRINKFPVIISKVPGKDGIYKYPDVFYTDAGLKNNTSYYYRIAGVDYFGRETEKSDSILIMPKNTTPPESPAYVKCDINNLNVKVKWVNPRINTGTGYQVYRSIHHNRDFTKVNKTPVLSSDTVFEDIVPVAGKYYYYLENCDSSGNCAPSHLALADIPDIIPPAKPQMLNATADTGLVRLSWTANNEPDLLGYRLYRTINNDDRKSAVLINTLPIKGNSFVDTLPVKAKNKFIYQLAAIDTSYNRSELSNPAEAVLPDVFPPEKPFIKNIRPDSGSLVIEWIPNVDPDLKGYAIYRASYDSVFAMKQVNSTIIEGSFRSYKDNSIVPGEKYYYTLVAIDSAGNKSVKSDLFTVMVPQRLNSLIKIAFTKARYNKNSKKIDLTWRIPRESDYTGIVVFRKEDNETLQPVSGILNKNDFSDSHVLKGKNYYYQLRFYDHEGNASKSDEIKITVPES
jgi:fibronectin type 3 domain-containing protein